MITRNVSWG